MFKKIILIFFILSVIGFAQEDMKKMIEEKDYKEVSKYLEENKENLDYKDRNGDTLLHIAAYGLKKELCNYLIEKGANLEKENLKGETPFYKAVFNQDEEIGYDRNIEIPPSSNDEKYSETAMRTLINSALKSQEKSLKSIWKSESIAKRKEILTLFGKKVENIEKDKNFEKIMDNIIEKKYPDEMQYILKEFNQKNIESVGDYLIKKEKTVESKNSFIYSFRYGTPELAEYIYNKKGYSLSDLKKLKIEKELLKRVTLDIGSEQDKLFLQMIAGVHYDFDIEKYNWLLEKGYNINEKDVYGATILDYAILYTDKKVIEELITLGADPDIEDINGRNGVFYAAVRADIDILKTVAEKIKNISKKDINGDNVADFYNKSKFYGYRSNFLIKPLMKSWGNYNEIIEIFDKYNIKAEKNYDKKVYYKDLILLFVLIAIFTGILLLFIYKVKDMHILLKLFLVFLIAGIINSYIVYRYFIYIVGDKIEEGIMAELVISPMCDIDNIEIKDNYTVIYENSNLIFGKEFSEISEKEFLKFTEMKPKIKNTAEKAVKEKGEKRYFASEDGKKIIVEISKNKCYYFE